MPSESLSVAQAISRIRLELGSPAGIGSRQRDPGQLPLLVVDRAEYLDAATGFVLAQLVQSRSIRLLLIAGSTHTTGQRLEPVLTLGQLAVFTLDGVNEDGIAYMGSSILGGPLSPGSVKVLHEISGGLPILAEACVRAARDRGLLARRGEFWVLGSDDLSGHQEVETAVFGLQGELTRRDADALLVLAMAGPQSLRVLEQVTATVAGQLVQTGLVRTGMDGKLSLHSTVLVNVLRRTIPPGRSATLWGKWSAICRGEWEFHQVWWGVSCAVEVDGELVHKGIRQANDEGEFKVALQLCELEVVRKCHDVDLERIRALEGLGRYTAARASIEVHACRGTSPRRICDRAVARHLSILLGAGASPDRLLETARQWEVGQKGMPPNAVVDACIDGARLVAAWQRGAPTDGQWGRVVSVVACGDPDVALSICGMALKFVVFDGMEMLEVAASLMGDLAKVPPTTASRFLAHMAVALLLGGHVVELEKTLELLERVRGTLKFGIPDLVAFFGSWQRIREGETEGARIAVRGAGAGLEVHGIQDFAQLALRVGDYANEDASSGAGGGRSISVMPSGGRALTLAQMLCQLYGIRRQPGFTGRTILTELMDEYQAAGIVQMEIEVLLEVLRREDLMSTEDAVPRTLKRLIALVSTRPGAWNKAVAGTARSWLSDDPNVWLATAREVETSEYPGLGLVAWSRVVVGSGAGSGATQRGLALRRMRAIQETLGRVSMPIVRQAFDAGDLTEREEEILKHAAVGLSNREIARELTLSQRTVEGHLYRIFIKLGISERSELVHFA
jgi:Response regulator containing a CheY-like receiver domain and an HTH DNA-binding domain